MGISSGPSSVVMHYSYWIRSLQAIPAIPAPPGMDEYAFFLSIQVLLPLRQHRPSFIGRYSRKSPAMSSLFFFVCTVPVIGSKSQDPFPKEIKKLNE